MTQRRKHTPHRWMPRAVLPLLLALPLAGCGAATPDQPSADDAVLAEELAALDVSVLQLRTDYAVRGLQVRVVNNGKRDITVTSARFSSGYFDGPVSSLSTPSDIEAGSTTDLRLRLPEPACSPSPDAVPAGSGGGPLVTLGVSVAGASATAEVIPADPLGSLELLHTQDCSRAQFEAVAALTVADVLRVEQQDGVTVARLDVTITPTGAAGEVRLDAVGGTVLLRQPEGPLREFGLTLTAESDPATLTLSFVPNRCDPHVVAEDKVGTLLPFHVDAGPFTDATFLLPVSDGIKGQFYEFVGDACGW